MEIYKEFTEKDLESTKVDFEGNLIEIKSEEIEEPSRNYKLKGYNTFTEEDIKDIKRDFELNRF